MSKTQNLVHAAAAVALAMTAAGCTDDGAYKHCSDLQQPAQKACIAQDSRGTNSGYYYGGYWYYGPRTLSNPGFSGVRYTSDGHEATGRGGGGFGGSGDGGD